VRAGDDAAFEAIYDRYYLGLLAFCRHMLGSRHEAEDALQHSFASAYRAMRAGQAVTDLRPWLYTIARNRCLSALRAQREELEVDRIDLERVSLDGLGAQIQMRAELRELVDDLQRLPDDQRAALVLFELGDHSHAEIAAVLDVRREKIKGLVFQARAGLLRAREARDASCADVREQLASLLGRLPARGVVRAHVDRCHGCAAFEHEVRRQRKALAAILPVAPTVGLKGSVLGFALGGGGGAAALTGAGAGGGATVAATGALAAGGAGVGGGGAVGVAGALGGAGAATVAGGLATGTSVTGSVVGATAKGLVAKVLAVVAVAGGTGEARQIVSAPPPSPPSITASKTPKPASGHPIPAPHAIKQSADTPAPATQGAPADAPVQAGVPAADPFHADLPPSAAPASAPLHVTPQSLAGPSTESPTPDPAPAPSAEPTTTSAADTQSAPATSGDTTSSTATPSASSDAGAPTPPAPSTTIAPDASSTATTLSPPADPAPPAGPSASAAQAQE
jgi:RNA polymerase sigma factor (sigma-70 family)